MEKFIELASKYINASSEEEMLKYENLLYFHNFIPILLFLTVFNMLFFSFFHIDFRMTVINTLGFVGIILVFLFAKYFVKSEHTKSNIIIAAFSIFLVFLFTHYYDFLFDVVWSIAAIFIVISMGRNDNKMLIFISIDMVILSGYAIIRFPLLNPVQVFVSRILTFLGLLFVITVIKKIHKMRVDMIRSQLIQTEVIAQISSEMITINQDNYKSKIIRFLELIGTLNNIDRISILKLSADKLSLINEVEWNALGFEGITVQTIDVLGDYWWCEQIESREIFVLSDVDTVDSAVCLGKKIMQQFNIRSLISIPILLNENIYGFLVINTIKKLEKWRVDEKRMMTVLANMLGAAYLKLENEKNVLQMAYYDVLTGLPNRFMFNNKLDEYLEYAKINNTDIAVLFIDLDSFKSINDTLGHKSGDALLVQLAKNLNDCLKQDEMIARFGGDEFVFLRTNSEGDCLTKRMQEIMAVLNEPVTLNGQKYYVTASVGVAVFPDDGEDSDTLVKNADLAMYKAKELGKNQFAFCNSSMKQSIEKQVYISNLLNQALERNEFVLFYQPQINLATKKIIGVEALIRWNNPELGIISPGVFIPIAEQSGMIHPIGKWVMNTALSQNKKWHDMGFGPLRMAVNLSVEQFRNPELGTMVKDAIEQTGLDAKFVELEVTESVSIKETDNVIATLIEFKDLGVSISIDDFGTEYSSLARIKNLPIDRIKIAMEFVQGISVSKKDEAIAKSIITLADSLGLGVIAEGVETEQQLYFLENKMCDEVQGFYYYRPMPAEELEKILEEHGSCLK